MVAAAVDTNTDVVIVAVAVAQGLLAKPRPWMKKFVVTIERQQSRAVAITLVDPPATSKPSLSNFLLVPIDNVQNHHHEPVIVTKPLPHQRAVNAIVLPRRGK